MRFSILLATAALACTSTAQPTWRFHLAFEDGTGARDTLWFIYDSTVTQTQSHWPLDSAAYAQSQSLLNYDDGNFHVFTINDFIDSTNSMAFPYTWYPIFETGGTIDAINWIPPMTITWDTSLFHAPYLPYDQGQINQAYMGGNYFFFHSNDGSKIGFNMLLTDSVVVDEDSEFLFPFGIYFSGDGSTIGITGPNNSERLILWPNPARYFVHIPCTAPAVRMIVCDQLGRLVHAETLLGRTPVHRWDVSTLTPGTYFVTLLAPNTSPYHASFQKVE